jgi:SAM-dependent methyltransferase
MNRPCPLCNARSHTVLRTMRYALFDDSSLPAQTSIVRCCKCRFIYASSDAQAADYLTHYQQNSIYAAAHLTKDGDAVENGPLEERAGRFLPKVAHHGTVVDVGAGSGTLLAKVRALRPDIRCVAIDPDPTCVELLRSTGCESHLGTLENLPPSLLHEADVVILSHVLEHLWRPVEGVIQAAALLRPHGLLYLETPDRQGYADHPNVPFYYFDPEHINHFSLVDLARVGAPGGLQAVALERSTLKMPDGSSYPVCWATLQPSSASRATAVVVEEPAHDPIESYLRDEETRMQSWLRAARECLNAEPTERGFILWGTGSQAQRTLAEGLFDGLPLSAVVDSDPAKQRRKIAGCTVVAPDEALAGNDCDPVVILAARTATQSIQHMLQVRHPHRPFLTLTMLQAP